MKICGRSYASRLMRYVRARPSLWLSSADSVRTLAKGGETSARSSLYADSCSSSSPVILRRSQGAVPSLMQMMSTAGIDVSWFTLAIQMTSTPCGHALAAENYPRLTRPASRIRAQTDTTPSKTLTTLRLLYLSPSRWLKQ